MTLLPDEKLLYRHEKGPVVTTHRVFVGEPERHRFVSIMLEQICSIEIVGRSFRGLIVTAFVFLGLAGVFAYSSWKAESVDLFRILQGYGYFCLALFVVFIVLWAVIKERILSISSSGARAQARAIRAKSFIELVEVVEAAKNRRVMMLANIPVSGDPAASPAVTPQG